MNKIITKYRATDSCYSQGMKNHSPNYHFLFRCDDSPSMLAACYTPAAQTVPSQPGSVTDRKVPKEANYPLPDFTTFVASMRRMGSRPGCRESPKSL